MDPQRFFPPLKNNWIAEKAGSLECVKIVGLSVKVLASGCETSDSPKCI